MEKTLSADYVHRYHIKMHKFVVLFAVMAVCAAQVTIDTPEVAHAKLIHYAAVAEARARTLGVPVVIPSPIVRTSPIYTPIGAKIFDDVKYRHDLTGEYIHTLPALPPVAPLPYIPAPVVTAPVVTAPVAPLPLVPATRLYDDGQYHKDLTGHLVHRYIPAPLK